MTRTSTPEVPIPEYAIVGHPNEGKSSVVATLTEDDQVRISDIPGETMVNRTYPVQVDGQEILRFIDTPGFQHPRKMLEWMEARDGTVSNLAQAFREAHRDQPAFAQDLELLGPLAHGSGIIYVVDGSRPVRAHDQAEMEILRLCGNPRMAIINPKEQEADYLEDWKAVCARCFNAIRTFNAVRATYAERIALLESLKGIQQDWEPALGRAINAFTTDWTQRSHQVAGIFCDLLRDALRHKESRNVFKTGQESSAQSELIPQYQQAISRMEEQAREEIRRLYKHNIFDPALPQHSILRDDLFTEKTWQVLGLKKKQIVVAAALLGAGAGVKLDLVLANLSFGLFTASGAALGAAAAWFKGENMARAKVQHLKLGGVQVVVGPNQNPQFPFVLIDRLLLYYQTIINWAHARQDQPGTVEKTEAEPKLGFTAGWSKERRNICLKFCKSLSKNNPAKQEEAERACLELFQSVLADLAT